MYKDFCRSLFMYKVQEKGEKSEGCGWFEPGGDSSGKIWCTRNKAYYYPYESSNGCSGYFTRK